MTGPVDGILFSLLSKVLFVETVKETQLILKKYWGHDHFRPMQEDIVKAVLDKQDVLALLPTGGGKSVCFQVPAMMLDGICLVVSPLIALMKDQVSNLSKKGIPALAIFSGMPFAEVKRTLQNAAFGNYKFLYVSPERLETALFQEFLPAIKPVLLAVDEAHCISQWGYDFRPAYLGIAKIREQLPDVPVIALTASATLEVQDDICNKLLFSKNQQRFQQSFSRPNLSYSVYSPSAIQSRLLEILRSVKGTAIVYCKSRKQTQEISTLLNLHKLNASFYHAGLSNEERSKRQQQWINNEINTIVCTNAFGMGIDKPDVRLVVHTAMPESLENYYQEAGRAGRDGKRAYAVLLYQQQEIIQLEEMNEKKYPSPDFLKTIYYEVMDFLQVPAGIGEGQIFPFDIGGFSAAFKRNILDATYAIQAIAQEGFWQFNEMVFRPATLVFTVSKNDLNEWEQQHPDLSVVIKGLLRNYEGIFDYPSGIYENQLSQFIGLKVDELRERLTRLHISGIVNYQPQSEEPQLQLLMNRMYKDAFRINSANLQLRKEKNKASMLAMINYTLDGQQCRSVMIGRYFNDLEIKPCGICDHCIQQKEMVISPEVYKQIADQITESLGKQSMTAETLLQQLKGFGKKKYWVVLNHLLSEEIIEQLKNGMLSLKTKS
jgi:ATP-dependent DNA helicase RecQ